MRDNGQAPPPAVEDGGLPAYDLSDYENPMVLLVSSPDIAEAA